MPPGILAPQMVKLVQESFAFIVTHFGDPACIFIKITAECPIDKTFLCVMLNSGSVKLIL